MSMSDTLLFGRWRQRGDAEAFAEIVSRYSGMVYATCRRVLSGTEDAQDAAQECFIELMRASVDPSLALGPWLHTVAVRRSLDRSKSASRRARHELDYDQDLDLETFPSEPETAEVLGLIDEAITALPGPLRVLVIGRFLERRTHDDLAAALGVSEATVRHRLDKGVEQIRETLQRRGVTVEPYLLAAVMGSKLVETAPASLAVSLGKLALGGVVPHPGAVSAAMPPNAVSGTLSAWKVGALATVAAVVVAAAAAFLLHPTKRAVVDPAAVEATAKQYAAKNRKGGPNPAAAATPAANRNNPPAAPASAAKPELTVLRMPTGKISPPKGPSNPCTISGTVLDSAGQGVRGARVSATAWNTYDDRSMRVWCGETDTSGQYSVPGIELDIHNFVDVSASAEGYQTDGKRVEMKAGENHAGVNFTLPDGVSLNARVLDASGAPVHAAAVVCKSTSMSLRSGSGTTNHHIASTDAEGIFTMGFGGEGIASLLVVPPGQPETFFPDVPVGNAKTVDLRLTAPARLSGRAVYPDGSPAADVDIALIARYAPDGGTPDYAAKIKSNDAAEIGTAYTRQATTGPDGTYSFADLPAIPDMVLDFNRRPEGGGTVNVKLFTQDAGPIAPGEQKSWDCTLPSVSDVMTIRGRVLALRSGKPVDATVACENMRTHESSAIVSNFQNDGTYELKLSTPGTYEVWGRYTSGTMDGGRQETKKSIPWAAGATRMIDFRLPDPFTMAIRVVDTEGLPVPGAQVDMPHGTHVRTTKTDEYGRYDWDEFVPGTEAQFTIAKDGYRRAHSQRILGESGAVYPEETIILYRLDEPEEAPPKPYEALPRPEEVMPKPEQTPPIPQQALPNPEQVLPQSEEALPRQEEMLPNPDEMPSVPEENNPPQSRGRSSRHHSN